MKKMFFALTLLTLISLGSTVLAQAPDTNAFLFGDPRPDAPVLAPRGDYGVGVRTLAVVNPDQFDVVNYTADNPDPRYDRPLTLEIWYPAVIPAGEAAVAEYTDVHGRADDPSRTISPFTFWGRAKRDAAPDLSGGAYPLVIVSHGFPGSRFMMTYLTENLASKGYVVVAIDHTDSTFSDTKTFASTLLNRPLDILFVLNQMAAMGAADSDSFLAGLVDADHTALVGYSMGGYGSLNAAGAGFSPDAAGFFGYISGGSTAIASRLAGAPELTASLDSRIKAVVAFAPWGMNYNLWAADGLAGLNVPLL
ncbi:MAG: dienelactone hydrolase, partial [Anaerolineae bacterium]|nr:dienelactone hydrolase [Anaerolineae bacterium]